MVYDLELSQSHSSRDYKRQLNLKAEHGSSFQEEIPFGKRNVPNFDGKIHLSGVHFLLLLLVYQSVPHLKIMMVTFHLGGYKLDWWACGVTELHLNRGTK